jgi:hypothetical protein
MEERAKASGRLRALVPDVLRTEPQFRLLFAGQVLSLVGDRVMLVALPFAVLESGGSLGAVGLVVAAQLVHFLVFGLIGGVLSDRGDRKRVVIASDVARLVAQAIGGGLLVAGAADPWSLGVLAAVYGRAEAFFQPAFTGLPRHGGCRPDRHRGRHPPNPSGHERDRHRLRGGVPRRARGPVAAARRGRRGGLTATR